jgi:hypothetical protein
MDLRRHKRRRAFDAFAPALAGSQQEKQSWRTVFT